MLYYATLYLFSLPTQFGEQLANMLSCKHMTKIAIIEDDPVISQMYRMKFEADGFEVGVASDGKQGVTLAKQFEPDLILLDLNMPEMTGDQALAHIRKQPNNKQTPVIILTNLGKEEAPNTLKSLGISGYIVKANLTPRQVVERVKDVLNLQ